MGRRYSYVYYGKEAGRRNAARLLTRDETRRIAGNARACQAAALAETGAGGGDVDGAPRPSSVALRRTIASSLIEEAAVYHARDLPNALSSTSQIKPFDRLFHRQTSGVTHCSGRYYICNLAARTVSACGKESGMAEEDEEEPTFGYNQPSGGPPISRDTPPALRQTAAETVGTATAPEPDKIVNPAPKLHEVVRDFSAGVEASAEAQAVAPPQPLDPASLTVEKPGVGEPPPTLKVERVTIVPTPYPNDPAAPLVVSGYVRIDVRSAEFGELNAKLDEVIRLLNQSNVIVGETRDQLVAEIQAGQRILTAPKPDRNWIKVLLIHPLTYVVLAASGGIIGDHANQALHLLLRMLDTPIPL